MRRLHDPKAVRDGKAGKIETEEKTEKKKTLKPKTIASGAESFFSLREKYSHVGKVDILYNGLFNSIYPNKNIIIFFMCNIIGKYPVAIQI